jgi:hypothetical protein
MKDHPKPDATFLIPRHIRSYLTVNLVLAIVMTIVMVLRAQLKMSGFTVIDFLLFCFHSAVLTALFCVPAGLVESYLYRQKKGVLYEWRNRTRRRHRDRAWNREERRYWKNEAVCARLGQGDAPDDGSVNRTGLFASGTAADASSRPAILMTLAERFEREGKRGAAERCYITITERFADSPQAMEAARRLSSGTNARRARSASR